MPASAIVCPGCGYDFPHVNQSDATSNKGFAYSPLADVALIISTFAAAFGCCVSLYMMVIKLISGDVFTAMVFWPIAFFLQLGMLVVFLRVQK